MGGGGAGRTTWGQYRGRGRPRCLLACRAPGQVNHAPPLAVGTLLLHHMLRTCGLDNRHPQSLTPAQGLGQEPHLTPVALQPVNPIQETRGRQQEFEVMRVRGRGRGGKGCRVGRLDLELHTVVPTQTLCMSTCMTPALWP